MSERQSSAAFAAETERAHGAAPMPEARESAAGLLERSRAAIAGYAQFDQARVDTTVTAVAWTSCQPERAERLARMEVSESGMGRVPDKIYKNQMRVLGTLSEMLGQKSVGVIEIDEGRGLVKIAKPRGVFASLVPSTNTAPGIVQNAMMLLKGGNAVIFCPNSRTANTAKATCELIREQLRKVGAPVDLVSTLDAPGREPRDLLLKEVDCVLATGSAGLVKAAHETGRPAIGAGPGNSAVIIDETADPMLAAEKVAQGKIFDFATSCSAENSVIVHEAVYEAVMSRFRQLGGFLLGEEARAKLGAALWRGGQLNRDLVGRSPEVIASRVGILGAVPAGVKFFLVEEVDVGPSRPFSGEKLCVVLAVYRYREFADAVDTVRRILAYQGRGHSCGIHSKSDARILELAKAADVGRVIVDQVNSSAASGGFDNGLSFTAVLGCGSWGGNNVDHNVTWKDCINITQVAYPIEKVRPTLDGVFGEYLERYEPDDDEPRGGRSAASSIGRTAEDRKR